MSQLLVQSVLVNMKAYGITLLCLLWAHANAANGEKLSLSNVMEQAIKNYPEVEAMRARVSQAEARRQAAPSLPPPMVSVGSMGSNGPFSDLMENSIEVRQVVPFPTKLTAESQQRTSELKAAEELLQSRILAIRAETKTAYLELYRAREQIHLLEEKLRTFEAHSKRIGSLTLSDRITQTHIIRIQTEIELARNEIERAQQQAKVSAGILNVLMGQDPALALPELEEPPIPELPQPMARNHKDEPITQHPQIRALFASSDALRMGLSRAHSDWLPDFSLRYRYNRRYDGVMPNNSEVMLGVDLPFLFFWQPKGKSAEAQAQLDEAQSKTRQTENELKLQILRARTEATSLHTQMLNFKNLILPQALKRMKIAHSITPTDMESLNEHRESMESYISLQLAALNTRVEYGKSIAMLESLGGYK